MASSLSRAASQVTKVACQTAKCQDAAKSILDYVDFNVDPCSDFYQYTCGSWLSSASLPADKSSVGPMYIQSDKVNDVIHNILEGEYEDLYSNLKDGYRGFHTDDELEADKENFQNMKDYYNICMDTTSIDKLGSTPIYPEIEKIENVIFPLKNQQDNETYSANEINQLTDILVFLSLRVSDTLFSFSVNNDQEDHTKNAIFINKPKLFLRSSYYAVPETMELYKARLTDVLTVVVGEMEGDSFQPNQTEINQNLDFQYWSKERVQSAVNNFVELEIALAKILSQLKPSENPFDAYKKISLDELHKECPLIDVRSYVQGLVLPGTDIPETVFISSIDYLKALNQLLSDGFKLNSLQDYFIISYIVRVSDFLGSEARAAAEKLISVVTGSAVEPSRWSICTDYTNRVFGLLVGRYYVLRAFGSEPERHEIEAFINVIHDSWRNRIPNTKWLDNETKEKAMKKLNMIKPDVAYGTSSPDLRSPKSLAKYFDGLRSNQTSFYDTQIKQTVWTNTLAWKKVGGPTSRNIFDTPPQVVNAYYSTDGNKIIIPTGLIQQPLYDSSYPEYLNYGSYGSVIGHEFSHGFDSDNRYYNEYGSLDNWWTKTSSQEYNDKSQCFIDQYSKYNITGSDGNIYNINGELTLAENIADNGGLAASFYAYQNLRPNHKEQEAILPGLEQLSAEKLFFISFGRMWCSLNTKQKEVSSINTDLHSPFFVRVNAAVQNSIEFSETFNCPVGSPMNPVEKCKIW